MSNIYTLLLHQPTKGLFEVFKFIHANDVMYPYSKTGINCYFTFSFFFFFTSENELFSSKSCCVTKIFVPFGIHTKSRWANAGLDALQGILKVFHLDVSHL